MKKVKKFVTVLLAFLMVFSFVSCAKEKEVVIMDEMVSYAGYTSYEEALNSSDLAVFGTVKEIGKAYKHGFVISGGKKEIVKYYYYTPITIEVEEVIKGEVVSKTVTYNALGGTVDNTIYDYKAFDTMDFKTGDKILVFLACTYEDIGYECIGPQCVISEDENGKATRDALGDNPSADTLAEHIELAKSAYESMLKQVN